MSICEQFLVITKNFWLTYYVDTV